MFGSSHDDTHSPPLLCECSFGNVSHGPRTTARSGCAVFCHCRSSMLPDVAVLLRSGYDDLRLSWKLRMECGDQCLARANCTCTTTHGTR